MQEDTRWVLLLSSCQDLLGAQLWRLFLEEVQKYHRQRDRMLGRVPVRHQALRLQDTPSQGQPRIHQLKATRRPRVPSMGLRSPGQRRTLHRLEHHPTLQFPIHKPIGLRFVQRLQNCRRQHQWMEVPHPPRLQRTDRAVLQIHWKFGWRNEEEQVMRRSWIWSQDGRLPEYAETRRCSLGQLPKMQRRKDLQLKALLQNHPQVFNCRS